MKKKTFQERNKNPYQKNKIYKNEANRNFRSKNI